MEKYEAVLKLLLETLQSQGIHLEDKKETEYVPVGVSNRHVHLSQEDMDVLFGKGYVMTKIKDLKQPGQYACKETVILCGPKGVIEKVRILGPVRPKTQVEIMAGDSFKLGIKTDARLSGDVTGTPGVTLVGPKGIVQTKEGLMIAKRHIHMTPEEAKQYGVYDGQIVSIEVEGPRGGVYRNVVIRANNSCALECHIDTEEANAMDVTSSSKVKIIK